VNIVFCGAYLRHNRIDFRRTRTKMIEFEACPDTAVQNNTISEFKAVFTLIVPSPSTGFSAPVGLASVV